MSVTEFSVMQIGTRVRVVRGPYPMDPALVGRAGTIVDSSPYVPTKVSVSLDGDTEIRTFAPAELEILEREEFLPPDKEAARKLLSRP